MRRRAFLRSFGGVGTGDNVDEAGGNGGGNVGRWGGESLRSPSALSCLCLRIFTGLDEQKENLGQTQAPAGSGLRGLAGELYDKTLT